MQSLEEVCDDNAEDVTPHLLNCSKPEAMWEVSEMA